MFRVPGLGFKIKVYGFRAWMLQLGFSYLVQGSWYLVQKSSGFGDKRRHTSVTSTRMMRRRRRNKRSSSRK